MKNEREINNYKEASEALKEYLDDWDAGEA